MKIKKLKEYLLSKKDSVVDMPFGPETLVFKVHNKMFALIMVNKNPLRINLKCDPDNAVALRSIFSAIIPGYHMNKEHWNTIIFDGSVPDKFILKMIDESYDLIAAKLKK